MRADSPSATQVQTVVNVYQAFKNSSYLHFAAMFVKKICLNLLQKLTLAFTSATKLNVFIFRL